MDRAPPNSLGNMMVRLAVVGVKGGVRAWGAPWESVIQDRGAPWLWYSARG